MKGGSLFIGLLVLIFSAKGQTIETLHTAFVDGTCSKLILNEQPSLAEDAEYWYLLGLCAHQNQNYSQSVACLRKADSLGFAKQKGRLWWYMARSLSQLHQVEPALAGLENARRFGFLNYTNLQIEEFHILRADPKFLVLESVLKPSFDSWTALFLFVVMQAIFLLLVLLAVKGNNRYGNVILAVLVLTFAITLFSYVLYWTQYNAYFPYLNYWYEVLMLLGGPLFYCYLCSRLLEAPTAINLKYHLLFPLFVALVLSPYLFFQYWRVQDSGLWPWMYNWMLLVRLPITKVLYLGFYLGLSIRAYMRSDWEHSYMKVWFNYLLIAFSGYYLSIVSYYVLINFKFFDVSWDYGISFAMSFFIFSISFLGYAYPQVLLGQPLKAALTPFKYKNAGLTEQAEVLIKNKLVVLMREELLFTKNDLSLDDLANAVGSSRHHVSLVVNKYFEQNFFDFLNTHRVEYFKQLLLQPENDNIPVIQLAYDAGFNNKVSFNKAFKKNTGTTPAVFRKEQVC